MTFSPLQLSRPLLSARSGGSVIGGKGRPDELPRGDQMTAHGLLGIVRITAENGLEDCFMPSVVHLIDPGTPLHGAPMLGQPLHIGLVNRRIDRIARYPIQNRMKGSVG